MYIYIIYIYIYIYIYIQKQYILFYKTNFEVSLHNFSLVVHIKSTVNIQIIRGLYNVTVLLKYI